MLIFLKAPTSVMPNVIFSLSRFRESVSNTHKYDVQNIGQSNVSAKTHISCYTHTDTHTNKNLFLCGKNEHRFQRDMKKKIHCITPGKITRMDNLN